jgi:hypothetical protein
MSISRRDKDRKRSRRMRQARKEQSQWRRTEQRRDPVGADDARQPAEHGNEWRSQPNERRGGHHEQQVLQHVDLKQ